MFINGHRPVPERKLHRMRLTYEALAEGYTGVDLLKSLLHEFGANPQRNGHVHA